MAVIKFYALSLENMATEYEILKLTATLQFKKLKS